MQIKKIRNGTGTMAMNTARTNTEMIEHGEKR